MVNEKDVAKRIIEIKQQVFDSRIFYKSLKEKLEKLGYDFIEKEHEKKDTKYGYEFKFIFEGSKKYDDFCKAEITVTAALENLNKIKIDSKTLEKGDGTIKIEGKIKTDYKNKWSTTALNKFLFEVYSTYFIKARVKKLYIIPTWDDVEELYNTAKESLNFYYKY